MSIELHPCSRVGRIRNPLLSALVGRMRNPLEPDLFPYRISPPDLPYRISWPDLPYRISFGSDLCGEKDVANNVRSNIEW